jgi:hypothetical protein
LDSVGQHQQRGGECYYSCNSSIATATATATVTALRQPLSLEIEFLCLLRRAAPEDPESFIPLSAQ